MGNRAEAARIPMVKLRSTDNFKGYLFPMPAFVFCVNYAKVGKNTEFDCLNLIMYQLLFPFSGIGIVSACSRLRIDVPVCKPRRHRPAIMARISEFTVLAGTDLVL